MRRFLDWFTPRRIWMALAVLCLILLGVLSSGRTPEKGEWLSIPDLGFVLSIVIGGLALLGAFLLAFGKPRKGRLTRRENRSMRTVLIMVLVIGAAAILFGPDEPVLDAELGQEEQLPLVTETPGGGQDNFLAGENADTLALVLAGLIVLIGVIQVFRRPRTADHETTPAAPTPEQVEPAVRRAQRHLHDESEPRMAVLTAYNSLERSLADLGHPRAPADTPSEHMGRVLAAIPPLESPGRQLGELFEVARFSNRTITESDRRQARVALDEALALLPVYAEGEV